MLHIADYIIIGIVLLSMLFSFMRGFVREALSVVIWIMAFWVALHYASYLSPWLDQIIDHKLLQFAASFIILFIIVLIFGVLVSHLFSYFVKTTGLSGTDRGLGLLFGFIRGVLIISIGLFLVQMLYLTPPSWWQQSIIIKQSWVIMQPMQSMLPESLHQHINPKFSEVR